MSPCLHTGTGFPNCRAYFDNDRQHRSQYVYNFKLELRQWENYLYFIFTDRKVCMAHVFLAFGLLLNKFWTDNANCRMCDNQEAAGKKEEE